MIARFFSWLETRVDSFPLQQPGMPPTTFWRFILHYTRPFWPTIIASSALSAVIALIEVSLFGFLGNLVDWLSRADRATFWSTHGQFLAVMGVIVLLILPVMKFFYESDRAPGRARQLRHAHPLAGAPLRVASVDGLLQRRLRRPRRHQGHADGDGGARGGHEDHRGAAVRRYLFHRRRYPVCGDGLAAVGAAHPVAGRLPHHHALLHSAPGPHLACPIGCSLDHDGARRRHLHQHFDGEDVRAC